MAAMRCGCDESLSLFYDCEKDCTPPSLDVIIYCGRCGASWKYVEDGGLVEPGEEGKRRGLKPGEVDRVLAEADALLARFKIKETP